MPFDETRWRLNGVLKSRIINTSFKVRDNVTIREYLYSDQSMDETNFRSLENIVADMIISSSSSGGQAGP